ncbi:MAG: Fmu (Sun) domain-containing protein [Chitinophagales bacterium]|nr:Fmu (Sun) domain-containing protein [Chitinophagales bacterium]
MYKGEMPFSHFLKAWFKTEKKFGSRDRKVISDLCYSAFRLGKAGLSLSTEERILTGYFLTHQEPSDLLASLRPEWNEQIHLTQAEKIDRLNRPFDPSGIFPWLDQLSHGIEGPSYSLSFLIQPDLYLRIRPGHEKAVIEKLNTAKIPYTLIGSHTLQVQNGIKLEEVVEVNREVVVQDLSSQHCLDQDWGDWWIFRIDLKNSPQENKIEDWEPSNIDLKNSIPKINPENPKIPKILVWDVCAASGGKSILLWDLIGPLDLTVSDSRASILSNLSTRFSEAGIQGYKKFVADLTRPVSFEGNKKFDLMVVDAPCTGSGTWGRTPEQLVFFEQEKIGEYVQLQRQILTNSLPHLKPGGRLVYITCSVFKEENEGNVKWLEENFSLTCLGSGSIEGYTKRADSLYSAFFEIH